VTANGFTRKQPSLTSIAPAGILARMKEADRIDINLWWLPSKERAVR
jgi:hypothetical protein